MEIISWLDACTRYTLHVSAHPRVTTPIVLATFRETSAQHGVPASTLTDNAMVYTVRWAGGRGGGNAFEHQLRDWNVVQKNSRPNPPTTCGKVERFQQTMKKWLAAQPPSGHDRRTPGPPRHLQPPSTAPLAAAPGDPPAAIHESIPKALPGSSRDPDTHHRIRHDRISKTGNLTLRVAGRLRHIGVGRTHAGTHVILLAQDLDVRIINAITANYSAKSPSTQPWTTSQAAQNDNSRTCTMQVQLSRMS